MSPFYIINRFVVYYCCGFSQYKNTFIFPFIHTFFFFFFNKKGYLLLCYLVLIIYSLLYFTLVIICIDVVCCCATTTRSFSSSSSCASYALCNICLFRLSILSSISALVVSLSAIASYWRRKTTVASTRYTVEPGRNSSLRSVRSRGP